MPQLILEKILSNNFRNLDNQTIQFNKKINCIFGNNGNGKSNLLEVVQVLLNRKSFRKKASFPQFLSMDCVYPEIIISSLLSTKNSQLSYSLKINEGQFNYSLNGKLTKDKIKLSSIFINPFDAYSFHHNPKESLLIHFPNSQYIQPLLLS